MKQAKESIFATDLDEPVIRQFEECMKQPFVLEGALMPDAHFGYVAPIGAVLVTKVIVVPSWVGYDIGCGVIALKLRGNGLLEKVKKKRLKIQKVVAKRVPMGLGKLRAEHTIHKETLAEFEKILDKLEKSPHNEEILSMLKRKAKSNLGTLGHGNHFIELDYSGKEVWLVIHCGSRNIGHRIAGHYMKEAMKEAGETGDVERTFGLNASSKLGKEYLAVLGFCLDFALLNRMEIAKHVVEGISFALEDNVEMELWANKNHNHAEQVGKTDKFVHRKGATPSKKGEKGVIPGNMRDGSFLVIGKGNKSFLESSSHGAGRAMSKRDARQRITMEQFKDSMKGITAYVEGGTLDEAPEAYKNINRVMKEQEKSVGIYKHLKPIINWKGSNSRR